ESAEKPGSLLGTSPDNLRHVSLKGLPDNRGLPKKGGAGSHNWGNLKDEVEASEADPGESTPNVEKIKVLGAEEFSKLNK
ncbi:Plasminogen activator inhibitor 1 RNA-binding protein, partial [Massospora cicadina]